MVKLYFVCMGNYYRSRLAEELAVYYAEKYGLDVIADSGGLSDVEHSRNPGPIAKATIRYLEDKNIEPRSAKRYPKRVAREEVFASDIVILTDEDEQRHLFIQEFPDFAGNMIGWRARDHIDDPWLQTPFLIDKHVHDLIKRLSADT